MSHTHHIYILYIYFIYLFTYVMYVIIYLKLSSKVETLKYELK